MRLPHFEHRFAEHEHRFAEHRFAEHETGDSLDDVAIVNSEPSFL